jgi:hypothetical protein
LKLVDFETFEKRRFYPIPASGSNINLQNTPCVPVIEIFAFLGLEQNGTFFKGLILPHTWNNGMAK